MLTGGPPYGSGVIRFLVGDERVVLEPLPDRAASLAQVVSTALSRAPEARYGSASAMLSALIKALETS